MKEFNFLKHFSFCIFNFYICSEFGKYIEIYEEFLLYEPLDVDQVIDCLTAFELFFR